MKKYKTLILDADDTLFDFKESEKMALKITLEGYGVSCDEETYQLYRQINMEHWNDLELGKTTQAILKYKRFEDLFSILKVSADVEAVADQYLENLSQQGILLEGAHDLVEALSKVYNIYIITNGITTVQKGRFQHASIMAYVKAIVISEEAGANKPNPQIFQYWDSLYGPFEKSEVLIVGDSLSSDIQGGIHYGIDTCWYNPDGLETHLIEPTYRVRSFEDIKTLLL